MEHLDWNWMYSALAQSVAAVVGVMVAVVLTLLQGFRERIREVHIRVQKIREKALSLQNQIDLLDLESHVRRVRGQAVSRLRVWCAREENRVELEKMVARPRANILLNRYGFSRYDDPQAVLDALRELVEQVRDHPPRAEPPVMMLSPLPGEAGEMDAIQQRTQRMEENLKMWLAWERDRVDPLYEQTRNFTVQVEGYLKAYREVQKDLGRWSQLFRGLLGLLAFLLVSGVGLPLWFLPVSPTPLSFWAYLGEPVRCAFRSTLCSWKVVLIVTFVLGGVWILWMLRRYVQSLVRGMEDIGDIKRWKDLEAFSPYFRNPKRWKDLDRNGTGTQWMEMEAE